MLTDIRRLAVTLLSLASFGVIVGIVAGALASAFTLSIQWFSQWSTDVAGLGAWVVVILLAGALCVGLLLHTLPGGRPLGPADALEATHRHAGEIDAGQGLRGALVSFVALASGASAGQYGPLVHFGATLGSLFARIRAFGGSMRTIGIGCGVAAAIAAAFSAPIAGLVFAHEVLLRHYSLRAFAPITVAAVTGHLFGTSLFDQPTLRVLQYADALSIAGYLACALLGVLCALLAWLFMRGIERGTERVERLPIPLWLKPAMAAAATGALALLVPEVLGVGLLPLRDALLGHYTMAALAGLLLAKLLATIVCLSCGFAGGVFSPSLLLGTLFGALFTLVLAPVLPDVGSTVFAVAAMAALASAVIGAPLTSILIVFELTRNYDLTTAVMVAVVFANLVSYRIYGRSFFDRQLYDRGIDFSQGHERVRLQRRGIAEYVDRGAPSAAFDTPVDELREDLLARHLNEVQLVDANGIYRGSVRLADLQALPGTELASLAQHEVVLSDSTSVWDAMQALERFVGSGVAVVSSDNRYLGVLYESGLIRAYLDTLDELRREEHAIG